MDSSVVSIIPARGGSKGIPRKNIRILDGDPLIGHAIQTSLSSNLIDSVVVTTDDQEIGMVAETYDVDHVITRPADLAADDVPLAPVIEHATESLDTSFEYVLCFQPTVPLLNKQSLDDGIRLGIEGDCNSVVYVRDSTHNYWQETDSGVVPFSEQRKNRQQMRAIYEEVGVFLSESTLIEEGRRVGNDPTLYEVDIAEGNDIDTYTDWVLADSWVDRQSLLYRLTGNKETGIGHIHRGLTIAMHSTEHDITFAVAETDDLAIEALEKENFDYEVLDSDEEIIKYAERNNSDIVVNDVLKTSADYMRSLGELGVRTVNIEDLSAGSDHADAVINALYEFSDPPNNHHYGHRYFCLRNEFRYASSVSDLSSVDRIMVSFGGTDINDLTSRTLTAINRLDIPFTVDVVLGPGYDHMDTLERTVSGLSDQLTVEMSRDVSFMSDHMESADLLVTSNGRTIYEATALNLPMISIAQNQREQRHPFVHVTQGIINLGLANYVSEEDIFRAVSNYTEQNETRDRMRTALSDIDIKSGVNRVKEIIFDKGNKQ